MHIAMTIGDMDPHTGGPPQVVAGSAAALARRGHRVSVFTRETPSVSRAFDEQFDGLSVELLRFPVDAPAALARSSAMKQAFAAQCGSIDVLHAHGIWEGHLAQLAQVMRSAGKPVVVSSHGMLDSWSMRQSAWKKQLVLALGGTGSMLSKADAVVFGTEEESAEGRKVVPNARHVIVPNGIDSATIARITDSLDPSALLARLPVIATWRRTILYFSRIHPKKGLDLLVDAFALHKDQLDGVGLLVVGIPQDAGYLAAIERTIAENDLSGHIAITTDLTGPDAKIAFAVADVFALPSHQEGFSMAIVEAMAAGKPLLITDKCHMAEVADWQAGVVVPDTAPGIAQGLEQVISLDDDALAQMGRNGRKVAVDCYDWAMIAARLETLYLQAAQK
jgi:glycosyltransferase involved in cell wall biosynthesis